MRCLPYWGPWDQFFVLSVTPKVYGVTAVNSASPSVARRGSLFYQDYQKFATSGGEKARGASNRRGHRIDPSGREIEQQRPKEDRERSLKPSVRSEKEGHPTGRYSGGDAGQCHRWGKERENPPPQMGHHCSVAIAVPYKCPPPVVQSGDRRDAAVHAQDCLQVARALDQHVPSMHVPPRDSE